MATIRKRGTRWQVQVRKHGARAIFKTFTLRADAEAWGRLAEVSIERGEIGRLRQIPASQTLRSLLMRYLKAVTPTKRGARQEETRIATMLRHPVSSVPLAQLSAQDIAAYRDTRLKIVSGSSVRRELTILRHCLEIARREWGIPLNENPASEIKRPPEGKGRDRRLKAHEFATIQAEFSRCRNKMVADIVQFALLTAMRRGEILSLTWADISFEDRTVLLRTTKNGESRRVPLSGAASEILLLRSQTLMKDMGVTKISLNDRVFPMSSNALQLSWQRLRARANIIDIHFHDLRHEAISRFAEMGLSTSELCLISGHKDVRMLARYTHIQPEVLAKKLS